MHQGTIVGVPDVNLAETGFSSSEKPSESRRSQSRTEERRSQLFSRRTNSLLGVQVVACGAYVPDNVVTNEDLQRDRGFDPEWIEQRTGILARRHALPEQATSDLCVEAARRAIRSGRVDAQDIDLVVVGTFTPDHRCPSTACLVQDCLGLDAAAFDVQAACSGFVYALATGAQYVATGNSRTALVIGADCNTRIVDQSDRRIAPLFGDGAGAVLLSRGEPHQGLVCYQIGADGSGRSLLECPSGGARRPATPDDVASGLHYLQMDGRNVFKWAVRALAETIELVLNKSGMGVHDPALYLIHQANIRIIDYATEQLGIPADKVLNNLDRYGNTSAASIPILLDEAYREGRISRGDSIVMCGFGAGLTWGSAVFRW